MENRLAKGVLKDRFRLLIPLLKPLMWARTWVRRWHWITLIALHSGSTAKSRRSIFDIQTPKSRTLASLRTMIRGGICGWGWNTTKQFVLLCFSASACHFESRYNEMRNVTNVECGVENCIRIRNAECGIRGQNAFRILKFEFHIRMTAGI